MFRTRLTQNSPGVKDSAEKNDSFGSSVDYVDGRLAVGSPGETLNGVHGAGIVHLFTWNEATLKLTNTRTIRRDGHGMPGSNTTAAGFGTTVGLARGLTKAGAYDVVIGSPDDRVGSKHKAGTLMVANFTKATYLMFSQASRGVPGSVAAERGFGQFGLVHVSASADAVLIGTSRWWNDTGCHQYAIRSSNAGYPLKKGAAWNTIAAPSCASARIWGTTFGR